MKKIYLFLILAVCFPLIVNAEVVTVGGANYVIKEENLLGENQYFYPVYVPGNYLINLSNSDTGFINLLKTYKYDGTNANITAQEMHDLFYNSKTYYAESDITRKTDYIQITYYKMTSIVISGIDSATNQDTKKIFSNKLTYEEGVNYYTFEYDSEQEEYIFTLADVNAENFDYLKHLIDVPEDILDESCFIETEYQLSNTNYDTMYNDALEKYSNSHSDLTGEVSTYFEDFDSFYINGKRYYSFKFKNGDVYNFYVYDEEYNIFDLFLDSEVYSQGNYVFTYEYNSDKIKIYDIDFNLIKVIDGTDMLVSASDNWLYLYCYAEEGENTQYSIYRYALTSKENPTFVDKNVTIKTTGFTSMISKVYLNDTEISTDNYTTSGELTSLKLKKSYLNSLDNGEYMVKIVYSDEGYVTTKLNVNKPVVQDDEETENTGKENPKTGVMISLTSIAILAIGGTFIIKNSKNKKFNKI